MNSRQTKKTHAASLSAALAELEILLLEEKPAADALGLAAEDNDVRRVRGERPAHAHSAHCGR